MRRRSEHLHRLALRSVRPTETHSRIDPEDCADFQEFSEESEEGNRAFQEAYRQLTIEDILDQEGIVFRPQSSEVQAEPAQVFYNFEGVQRTGLIFEEFAEVEGKEFTCRDCKFYHGQVYNGVALICGIHPAGQEDCSDFRLR